jgi:hypothetical protein
MHTNKFLLVLVAVLTLGLLPGCTLFQTACAKALPVLTLGQTYAGEAAQAVEQAEAFAASLPLSPEAKAKVIAALEDARVALRTGQVALSAAVNACTQTDPLTLFASFVQAWAKLREVFSIFGPIGAVPGPGVRVGGLPFADPMIYRSAVAQAK